MATDLAELKDKAGAAEKQPSFPVLLKQSIAEIRRALPEHLSKDRIARIALTAFRRTPKLADCDPRSVLAAVIQSAQLGLELDTLGRAYLVPYKVNKKVGNEWHSHMECQFIPGWKGLVDLLNRSGQGTAWTGAVFKGDTFEYELGDDPHVKHKPAGDYDPEKLLYTYAIGRVKGSDYPVIEVWTNSRLLKHRDKYNKVGPAHYSFGNWEMYARKVVLLQVLKYMPLSAELATAVALDDSATMGRQALNIDDALDGTWTAVDEGGEDAADGKTTGGPAGSGAAVGTGAATEGNKGGGGPGAKGAEKQGGKKGNVERVESATKNFTELTPAEYVDRINNAETSTRVDDITDIARSRTDFTAEDKAFVSTAAKQWKESHQQGNGQQSRRASVE